MRNRFSGICYYCNKMVNKGEGHFEKGYTGHIGMTHWKTIHAECVFKKRNNKSLKEVKYEVD